ncbi:unnamed protein product [Rotaria socialis]|uniref:Uncharacterized protein n=2 Tax=Rotaria socialis TaxID=392032 RepID=A0A817S1J2_9BILA|nr:unnamed protein product [Rotaria socialis]CAF3264779.1 unnamed protein product [Rotaria socialis]CAF4157260.1 unnamed protein product [Rotaria socialis]CAF4298670.1 unnamed protein product [Rotaria socialis]
MLTCATLLILHELELLTNSTLPNRDYFRNHFEKDYVLIGQQCGHIENCHVWLFRLINHTLDETFLLKGILNKNQKVIELEKLIEERLIFAHINSVPTEINEYKRSFAEYTQKQSESSRLEYFVDELFENEAKYPLLKFFNLTNIYAANPIEKFRTKLQAMLYSEKIYPITTFLMNRLETYENIQYLYPIVTFTNYLIHKFNHRLKRNDAAVTTIEYYLTDGPDCETTLKLYESFLDAWYALNLKEVRFDCQTAKIEHVQEKEDFANNTMIAVVLLNASKDETSILLPVCLKTIGKLQSEVVNYFHNTLGTDLSGRRRQEHIVPVQSIRSEHLFEINAAETMPMIDTEKLQYRNYQFELYGENSSLITDVRTRVKQEPLEITERKKRIDLMPGMDNGDIVNFLGSLDYVFTYLRDIDMDLNIEMPTTQTFVEKNS